MVDLGGITLIVSGFPRSGTSMMMRMLMFGGVPVRAEMDFKEFNPSGPHNPYGSLELEDVGNSLKTQPVEWTFNHAVKLVSPYIDALPLDRPVKVIFMVRELSEIIASLMAMRSVWKVDIAYVTEVAVLYIAQNNIPMLKIHYNDAMKYPKTTALQIQEFLGVELDIDEMIKAVDKNIRKEYLKKWNQGEVNAWSGSRIINMSTEAFQDLKEKELMGGA